MSDDAVLLILGGAISLVSVLVGALVQHWLEIRKIRVQLEQERQTELEKEERVLERELLQELGRASLLLPDATWKQLVSEVDTKDVAILVAARLRARAEDVSGKLRRLKQSDLEAARYCLHCGAENKPGSKFCATCGAAIPTSGMLEKQAELTAESIEK